jgi:Uma2 family endonuclease
MEENGMLEKIRTLMSSAEFEALPESQYPSELIEGELMVRGVPKVNHQRVAFNIASRLRDIVPDGEVFIPPLSVKFDDANYYQPDVIWVAENSACEITEGGFNGPPDLVVEVLSPGTAKIDRGIKFQKYQQYAVREYWIVEPELGFLEIWHLVNAIFTQQGVYEADETFQSPVLRKEVKLDSIFPATTNS